MGELVRFARGPERAEPKPINGVPPPHDLEAELATIAAILTGGDSIKKVSGFLRPEHFFSPDYRPIYEAGFDLDTATKPVPVDLVSVSTWLKERGILQKIGGSAQLAMYIDHSPEIRNVEYHARIVFEKWRLRAFIATSQKWTGEAYHHIGETQELMDSARAELSPIIAPRSRHAAPLIGQVMVSAFRRIEDASNGIVAGVPSGFDEFDSKVGLFIRKQQTVIGGRPSMGKTQFAWQVALNVAATKRDAYDIGEAVYIASWEMPPEALVLRGTCIEAQVNTRDMEANRVTAAQRDRLTTAADWMSRLPLIIDGDRCTPRELRERVLVAKEELAAGKRRNHLGVLLPKCRLQLVMVDYLQKGKWPTDVPDKASREEKVAGISKGLVEDVAKGCDVATLVLAQVGRGVEGKNIKDRRPTMADLRESGGIEADADNILFVHREQFYQRESTPPELRNVAELIHVKGRYGIDESPTVRLGFYSGFFSNELPTAARPI